jgi:glycerol-3-phosphate acyltransferase PlsY
MIIVFEIAIATIMLGILLTTWTLARMSSTNGFIAEPMFVGLSLCNSGIAVISSGSTETRTIVALILNILIASGCWRLKIHCERNIV